MDCVTRSAGHPWVPGCYSGFRLRSPAVLDDAAIPKVAPRAFGPGAFPSLRQTAAGIVIIAKVSDASRTEGRTRGDRS
jgi:hypothetical protein